MGRQNWMLGWSVRMRRKNAKAPERVSEPTANVRRFANFCHLHMCLKRSNICCLRVWFVIKKILTDQHIKFNTCQYPLFWICLKVAYPQFQGCSLPPHLSGDLMTSERSGWTNVATPRVFWWPFCDIIKTENEQNSVTHEVPSLSFSCSWFLSFLLSWGTNNSRAAGMAHLWRWSCQKKAVKLEAFQG